MIKALVLSVLLSCLTASALAQTQPTPATKRSPRSEASVGPPGSARTGRCQVGVIPITGNLFGVKRIGYTIFGNEYKRIRVDDWGFDDLVSARVRAAAPRLVVQRISYDKEDLQRSKREQSLFRDADNEARDFVRKVASETRCERYLVVHISSSSISERNDVATGMGMVYLSSPIKNRVYLFALTYIRIYDGQSFELIKQGAALIEDEPAGSVLLGLTPFRGPKLQIDESLFPAAPEQAARDSFLRDGVRALLAASLDKTLPAMLRPQ